jgi:hypothetical protein
MRFETIAVHAGPEPVPYDALAAGAWLIADLEEAL